MILIISEKFDSTTNIVVSWLDKYKADWIRINDLEFLSRKVFVCPNSNEVILFIDNKKIRLTEIHAVWYRRTPKSFYRNNPVKLKAKRLLGLQDKVNQSLTQDELVLFPLIFYFGNFKYMLGNPYHTSLNKVYQISIAQKFKLLTPESIVTTEKSTLKKFKSKHQKIITKPLDNVTNFDIEKEEFATFTKIITSKDIKLLPDTFPPSLLQKYIEKEFEIRVFF